MLVLMGRRGIMGDSGVGRGTVEADAEAILDATEDAVDKLGEGWVRRACLQASATRGVATGFCWRVWGSALATWGKGGACSLINCRARIGAITVDVDTGIP